MINLTYNPFKKNLGELETPDLMKIRNVGEGWYIEYKRQVVNTKSIGKSLAAFANHYGGLLFYGIEGGRDETQVINVFNGIGLDEISSLLENVRNAAKDTVSPSPYYETKILEGPCEELGLQKGRAIVLVAVPSGADTPYIHSDGRIYRRVGDSSDPKPETDRFILDHLWQRRQQGREKLLAFLQQKHSLSENEKETSYIDLFLLPDPLLTSGQRARLSFEVFVKLMSQTTPLVTSIPFDNFFAMSDGFIARQTSGNNPTNLVLTWKFYENGFSWVSVPFPWIKVSELVIGGWLRGYEQETEFINHVKKGDYTSAFLLDINVLTIAIFAAIGQQNRLMKESNIKGPLYAKAVIHNIWRRVPFLDTASFISFIQTYGLPVIQFNDEFAPPGKTFESLRLITEEKLTDEENPTAQDFTGAAPFLSDILYALALPSRPLLSSTEEWIAAAQRAPNVFKWRQNLYRT